MSLLCAKPVVKWAGGKAQLEEPILKEIARIHPGVIERYYEPFLGGGAIFFALRRKLLIRQAVLSDSNPELINLYLQIQSEPEALIRALRRLKALGFGEARYYEVRENKPRSGAVRAARFIYLNKCGFNGLYRVNKSGGFNVPYGHHKKPPTILDEPGIWAAHRALSIADIRCCEYPQPCLEAMSREPRSFVYLDPPYWPTRPTADFTAYTQAGFGQLDQESLAGWMRAFADDEIPALLSNSDVPGTRKLYAAFKKKKHQARRNVNSDGAGRGVVSELLVESKYRK